MGRERTETKCPCCGSGGLDCDKDFYSTRHPLYTNNNRKYPVCKRCVKRFYDIYLDICKDKMMALYQICVKIGWYFDGNIYRQIEFNKDIIAAYSSKQNIGVCKGKTFEDNIQEDYEGKKSTIEPPENIWKPSATIIDRWGEGIFEINDYKFLEEHYKMLKSQNPNCDSNQEIFIKDLCYIKMQQMKTLQEKGDKYIDNFDKLTKLYRATFEQAGLKTKVEADSSNDESLGVTLALISQYTPEEYYKDKTLYKDYDGIGDYLNRFVLRPLRNLLTGSDNRDEEFCVKDSDK